MMRGKVTTVPRCRVGLAPAASLKLPLRQLVRSPRIYRRRRSPHPISDLWTQPRTAGAVSQQLGLRGQAHAALAAAILRQLYAVVSTGQRWDAAIAAGGRCEVIEPAA